MLIIWISLLVVVLILVIAATVICVVAIFLAVIAITLLFPLITLSTLRLRRLVVPTALVSGHLGIAKCIFLTASKVIRVMGPDCYM